MSEVTTHSIYSPHDVRALIEESRENAVLALEMLSQDPEDHEEGWKLVSCLDAIHFYEECWLPCIEGAATLLHVPEWEPIEPVVDWTDGNGHVEYTDGWKLLLEAREDDWADTLSDLDISLDEVA